jgi:uncharacterized protein YggU (UPF0235/DUF167 family)
MKVYVKPGKRENKILFQSDYEMIVEVKAVAQDNKANEELIKFLKSKGIKARMKSGFTSKIKNLIVDKK